MRHWFRSCFVLAIVLVLCGSAAAADPAWKAGVAREKITPPAGLWMAGYAARTRGAEGTLDDLWVKALAIESADGTRGVIVTSDLLGFPRLSAERICAALKEQCGFERRAIVLSASHTHSGPVLETALLDIYPLDDAQRRTIADYTAQLEKTVVATVARAWADRKPATLSRGEGTADIAVNRRNNTEAEAREARQTGGPLKGPSDYRVPVLAVRDADGALRAILVGYACHATTLDGYEWSGDYPGFAQLALEAKHPGAQAMFHAGCGADQNPLPRRSVELCRQYGEQLASVAEEVLAREMKPLGLGLKTAFATIRLNYAKQPERPALEAAVAAGGYPGRWAGRLLAELDAGRAFETGYDYPVQVWRLGDEVLWIVLGGEVVVDYALRLAGEYGPATWVTGYANDVMAYIPSDRVRKEGGYEAGAFAVYGLPAEAWTPTIEDEIVTAAGRMIDEVGGPAQ